MNKPLLDSNAATFDVPCDSSIQMLPLVRMILCLCFINVLFLVPSVSADEPTNATEAAQKKAKESERIERLYQAKKAALSPERLAWEILLEENLGNEYYLPIHKRDFVNGVSTGWDFVVDDPNLPRVLLLGDSISRGYTLPVRTVLAGKANVHRAPENCGPTANGLKKLDVWLGPGKWDLIHFNFGIHDRRTPLADYTDRLTQIVTRLQATGATLIWATTTPVPDDPAKERTAASIVERNIVATALMEKYGIAIDDLYTAIKPHLITMQKPKDVHFKSVGNDFLGQRVAESIQSILGSAHP
ncbi:SGNH/GDSL hydrolase family protein [Planctomycetota bacterium]